MSGPSVPSRRPDSNRGPLHYESQKERRSDRLEVSVTRIAAKGVVVGTGDDAKTLKYEDPEDALVFIERAIARGDLDADDIFDDHGKVQTDAVTEALADLLKKKPRLAAGAGGPTVRSSGSSDAGRGGGGPPDEDDLTPAQRLERRRKHKQG
jgi:hypothetical protein